MNPGSDLAMFSFKFLGYNLTNNKFFNLIATIIHELLFFNMLVLSSLEVILKFENVLQLSAAFQIIPHYLKGMCYIAICYWYMPDIKKIIKYKGFRPMNYCGPELEKKQMKIYRTVIIYCKSMAILACILIISIFIVPLFLNEERKLPADIYEFTNLTQSPIYEIAYILQLLPSCILSLLVLGHDSLRMSLLMFAYNQTMLLKHDTHRILNRKIITNKDEQKIFNQLRENIILHNRILKFTKKVNKIYSFPFLSELFICSSVLCMQFYILATQKNTDPSEKFSYLMTVGMYGTNLYILCVCCTMVTSQLESIQYSIYESNWYLSPIKSPRISKCLILMLNMSQRQLIIKAGGLFNLDMETFTTVLRLSYSYCTILMALS